MRFQPKTKNKASLRGKNEKPAKARHAVFPPRRIVVPLDFSGKSRQALELAVPLAERYGGKIDLVHVMEPVYSGTAFPGQVAVAPMDPGLPVKYCRQKLSALAWELVPPELLGKFVVRTGRAHWEIVDAARELGANLIALSTHGHTGFKHVLLGSTAEQVVRHASCPVLAVRQHETGDGKLSADTGRKHSPKSSPPGSGPPWRRILVPVDFSKLSLQAFEVAAPLARDLGARLILLSVVEPAVYPGNMEAAILTAPDAARLEAAKAGLPRIARRFVPPSLSVTVLVKRGRAFDVITRVAREMTVDLIVLASHGWTGLDRMLLGSTAERVVRHAHCPVYVVHRKTKRSPLPGKPTPAAKSKTK